ncbi:phage GP46 family protein [Sphingomonas sp. CBMAI 2297]|uniref:phage GP46 family protein n=1 Tax=Sphingomonas sp. CBMAI 2297 TaxID=2991720 RepID=UPI002456C300|nr:phage GP46 family protein [Sphingomonas sp. CBMAI 2297]MDH4745816.1 phage GP46 family protein [Sphingomonas sp. CBMAI 2297]
MADIMTIWDASLGRGDWSLPSPVYPFAVDGAGKPIIGPDGFAVATVANGALPGSGLMSGNDIETAVLLSLHTDAPADDDDVIPDASGDPRGWWGDSTMGSKLWLLSRAKKTPATLLLAKAYAEAACAWLVSDGAAASVNVTAEWVSPGAMLGLLVVVAQPDGNAVRVATQFAWKDL